MNQEQRLELATSNIQAATDRRIARIRDRLPAGASAKDCQECGDPIPARRRQALPGVQRCVSCQTIEDQRGAHGIRR